MHHPTALNPALVKLSALGLSLLLSVFLAPDTFAQSDPPLVYDEENTGAIYPGPVLPAFGDLPIVRPLTDPFEWSDGSGRDTTFSSWSHRRAQIGAEIEHYEIGTKPRPDDLTINATFTPDSEGGVLTVVVTRNSNQRSLALTSRIVLPEPALPTGGETFPAIIGMTLAPGIGGSGSLLADIFTSRDIATIEYVHNQVTEYAAGQQITHAGDPFYLMYPEFNDTNSGQYSAWSWGVSRLIDGLEIASQQLVNPLPINLSRLAVTGCSYAGKMALFAGTLDERVALTIAQESGGGGAPAWRVSETLGNVEKLGATDYSWFRDSMRQFAGTNIARLPHDHHELMAMAAPRALLVTGNTDFEWLANPSTYVSSKATQQVYETFGIADRFGFYIDGGHGHCAVPQSQVPAIEAFVDKFMLGDMTANTDVQVHPYETVNHERWYQWWGTGDPSFPDVNTDTAGTESHYFEAECADRGSDWEEFADEEASNGAYITVQAGLNSTEAPPTGPESIVTIPFSVSKDTTFYVFGRVNGPSADDDSFWLQFDGGDWILANGLATTGWQWAPMTNLELAAGDHTLTIAYREDGALLDKIGITTYLYGPEELSNREAHNCEGDDPDPVGNTIEGDDPSISRWKGWHEVEDEHASNGYYSRNVNGHQGADPAYLSFAFTGAEVDVHVARGPRGGDAEVYIDDVSQGLLSFYRAPSDPDDPDRSGKDDLTFDLTETYTTSEGEHTFRLEVRNTQDPTGQPKQDIVYIDGFTIRSETGDDGSTEGSGDPIELPSLITGTIDPTALVAQPVTTTASTQLLTGILEVPEGADLDLIVLDPLGAVLGESATAGSLEIVHVTPSVAGTYLLQVVNNLSTSADFALYQVLAQETGSASKGQASDATSVEKPTSFSLSQNYPNPFNPSTTITYTVPDRSHVRLAVYNALGQQVAVLVDGAVEAGHHLAHWDSDGLSSGIYVYRLTAGSVTATRKMLVSQ